VVLDLRKGAVDVGLHQKVTIDGRPLSRLDPTLGRAETISFVTQSDFSSFVIPQHKIGILFAVWVARDEVQADR